MAGHRKLFACVSIVAGIVVAAGGSGCAADSQDEPDDVGDVESQIIDSTTDGCAGQCTPDNCVGYARCRTSRDATGGTLPYGLTTFSQKLAVAHDGVGHRGCVAMIRTSRVYGHAAYVEDTFIKNGARQYRISEASWQYDYSCDTRTGTKTALGIAEFWCP